MKMSLVKLKSENWEDSVTEVSVDVEHNVEDEKPLSQHKHK